MRTRIAPQEKSNKEIGFLRGERGVLPAGECKQKIIRALPRAKRG